MVVMGKDREREREREREGRKFNSIGGAPKEEEEEEEEEELSRACNDEFFLMGPFVSPMKCVVTRFLPF